MNQLAYSVRRRYVDEFYERHVSSLPTGSRILDLGGHATNKRGRFDIGGFDLDVVYANMSTQKGADVQALAENIPFLAGSFDVVICAELLEHVPDPRVVLAEAYRTIREGGLLLLSAPFLYHVHADPYDYGRYTDHYWRSVLTEVGFGDVSIERHGLYHSVLADFYKQRLNHARIPMPFGRPLRWICARLFVLPFEAWARRRDRRHGRSDPFLESFTTGFGITATKLRSD